MNSKGIKFILVVILTGVAHLSGEERALITPAQIVAQLHLRDGSADISLPQVTCRVSEPRLIVSSQNVEGNAVRLRLRCERRACLPFYVTLRFRDVADAELQAIRLRPPLRSPTTKSTSVVNAGSSTLLEITSGAVRMVLTVKCLQSGSPGDWIRVRDEKTRRIYRAQIVDRHHVKVAS